NIVQATLKSDNTVYAQLDVDLGPKKVAETAHKLGITTKLDGVPSEGLGGLRLGVSPLEMADAYATLASGGMRSKPEAIKRFVGYTPNIATSVWVGYPNALKEMRSVHGISVAGGTIPATIWHDYMAVAHVGCGDFNFLDQKTSFYPFFGDHSSTGKAKPHRG